MQNSKPEDGHIEKYRKHFISITPSPSPEQLGTRGFPSVEFYPMEKRTAEESQWALLLWMFIAFVSEASQVFTKVDFSWRSCLESCLLHLFLGDGAVAVGSYSCCISPQLDSLQWAPELQTSFSWEICTFSHLRHQCHCHSKCTSAQGPRHCGSSTCTWL